jgi:hypothetical protein
MNGLLISVLALVVVAIAMSKLGTFLIEKQLKEKDSYPYR